MPVSTDLEARLQADLAELESRQKRVEDNLATPLPADAADRVTEAEDDAGLEAEAVTIARRIASVKRAIARIHDGTYGECVQCGEAISRERLDVRPEAALCINCARRIEDR